MERGVIDEEAELADTNKNMNYIDLSIAMLYDAMWCMVGNKTHCIFLYITHNEADNAQFLM